MEDEKASLNLTEEQKQLIEEFGLFNEKVGRTPAAARIIALLTIADRVELTFDEIRENLSLSKSATSIAINNLLNGERIDYITKHGDRKRYFRIKIHLWEDKIKKDMESFQYLTQLLKRILMIRNVETTKFNNELKFIISFLEHFNEELPKLFEKWHENKR